MLLTRRAFQAKRMIPKLGRRSAVLMGTTLAVSVVGLIAASDGFSASSAKCLPAPTTVNIGEFPYGTSMPTDLEQGTNAYSAIDKKFCTTVAFQYFQTAAPMVSGLSTGQLAFAVYSTPNNVNASVAGLSPFPESIATDSEGGTGILAAPISEEAQYGTGLGAIKKIIASGGPVGLVSVGGSAQLGVNAILEAAGVDYNNVQFVALGASGIGPATENGSVKLSFLSIGDASLIASKQVYSVVYSSGETGYKATGPYPQLALNVMPAFAAQYPALTQAMTDVELQGLLLIQKNWKTPDKVYHLLQPAYQATTPEAQWAATWPYIVGANYAQTGFINNVDVLDVVKLMGQYNDVPVSYNPPAKLWATPTFIQTAYKQLKLKPPTQLVLPSLIKQIPN
jgi:ABC-type nitrate/sulfonate/bicarbonate transport system substrate-binding protein